MFAEQHHRLLIYRMDLSKTDIVRKLMARYRWQFPSFSLVAYQKSILTNNASVKN